MTPFEINEQLIKSNEKILAQLKEITDAEKKLGKLTNVQLKKKIELQENYKIKLIEIRKFEAKRLEDFSDQAESLSSLSSIYSNLSKLDSERIKKNIELGSISEEQNEKIARMAKINREISQLGKEDSIQRLALSKEYEAQQLDLDDIATKKRKSGDDDALAFKSILNNLEEQNKLANDYARISSRQKDIIQGQHDVYTGISKTVSGTFDTIGLLFSSIRGFAGSIITAFGFVASKVIDVNKELGYTVFQTDKAARSAGLLSFAFDDTAGTVRSLAKEFGTVEKATFNTQLNVGLMASTMGISNTEAVSLLGSFSRINKGSMSVATDMIATTKEFAKQNKVIPADVLSDLADNTEAFALYAKKGGENMIKAAVGARKLGTTMSTLTGIADTLLDFETSITSELELTALLGRTVNLNKARQLAYDGKLEEATREALRALGGIDAFNRMDVFQKKASADALGISVGELQKMSIKQEHIAGTGEVIKKTFSQWGSIINTALNKGLGTSLKGLGGMVIAAGQFNLGLKSVGTSIGGIVKGTGKILKNVGSKVWQMLPGVGGGMKLSPKQIATGFGGKGAKGALLGKTQKSISKNIEDSTRGATKVKGKTGGGLKGLAGGLTKMGTGKVLFGALNLIPTALGMIAMIPALPGMAILGLVGAPAGAGLKAIGIGLKSMGGTKQLIGAGALVVAGIGFAAMTLGIPGMLGISLLGIPTSAGLAAIGVGLTTFGAAAMNPLTWAGVGLLAALGIALIPLGYALAQTAPAISAFGTVIKSVFSGIGSLVESVAGSFVTLMDSVTLEKVSNMFLLGPALISASAGLIAFSVAMATSSISSFFGGGIIEKLKELSSLAPQISILGPGLLNIGNALLLISSGLDNLDLTKLNSLNNLIKINPDKIKEISEVAPQISQTAIALMNMGTGIGLVATQLDRITPEKLDALSDFSITASIGSSITGIAESIGGLIGSITGLVEGKKLSDYESQMLKKMDALINEVKTNKDVYLDKEKVTNVIMKTTERYTGNLFGLSVA